MRNRNSIFVEDKSKLVHTFPDADIFLFNLVLEKNAQSRDSRAHPELCLSNRRLVVLKMS